MNICLLAAVACLGILSTIVDADDKLAKKLMRRQTKRASSQRVAMEIEHDSAMAQLDAF